MSEINSLITAETNDSVTIVSDFASGNLKSLQQQPVPLHITHAPPDGGARAWLVMAGAFLCNGILFGIINVYSVIYLSLQKQLVDAGDAQASSKAALVGSLTIGTTFLLSPVSGILTDKIGLRLTTLCGGILSVVGILISSFFTENITVLYFTYGVTFGLGAAMAYTPTIAILGHYFQRYLGVVNGIVTAGSSVFTVFLPLMLNGLVATTGLSTTFQIMAVLLSFVIVCAFLYKPRHERPPPPTHKVGRSALNTFVRSFINFDNWKRRRYIIWSMAMPIALFGYFVPYVHMGKFVKDTFPDNEENLPVICIGITSGVGRIIFGYIADYPRVNRILLQQIAFVMIGVMTMCLSFTPSFNFLLVIALLMGLFDGCFISLLGPIAYDICGPMGAAQAIGFMLGLSSVPLTVGPPIAGFLYDQLGSYEIPFILAGLPPIFGAFAMCLIRCVEDEPISYPTNTVESDKDSAPLLLEHRKKLSTSLTSLLPPPPKSIQIFSESIRQNDINCSRSYGGCDNYSPRMRRYSYTYL